MQEKVNLGINCMDFLRTTFWSWFSFMNMAGRLGVIFCCFSDICLCKLIGLKIKITKSKLGTFSDQNLLLHFFIPCLCLLAVLRLSLRGIHYLSFGLEG